MIKLSIAGLLMLVASLGGLFVGLSSIAYGIYLLILLSKGTIAVSFWTILKIVACWFGGSLAGWSWFAFWAFVSGLFAVSVNKKQ